MNNKLRELIEKKLKESGLTKAEFARRIGIGHRQNVNRLFSSQISPELLAKIEQALGIGKKVIRAVQKEIKQNITFVPVKAQAGLLAGFNDPEYMEDLPKFTFPGFETGEYFAFEIEGESMAGTFNNRDIAICEQLEKLDYIKQHEIYVILCNEGIVIKRLSKSEKKNYFICTSDNKLFKSYEVHAKEIRGVWKPKKRVEDV
jgi:phage repressor protein C with HTH and peptisase S24 domain